MNFKAMKGLLALGIKMKHSTWGVPETYLQKSIYGLKLYTKHSGSIPVLLEHYDPEISTFAGKYAEGWGIYNEPKINE